MADLTRQLFPQCGNCLFWHRVEMKGPVTIGDAVRGVCFGAPPTAVPVHDKQGRTVGQHNLRPMTPDTERACGLFTPIELLPGAANDLNG